MRTHRNSRLGRWNVILLTVGWLGGCNFLRTSHTCAESKTCPPADGGAAGEVGADSLGGAGGTSLVTAVTGQSGTDGFGATSGNTASGGAGGATITGTGGSGGSAGTGGSAPLPCDGACGGATPACDRATDTCVECTEDEPCTEGVCDPDAHACVECLDNPHCTEGVCDPDAHLCVECLNDDNCDEPTPLCDEEQFCVECRDSAHCADPQASFCDAGSCSPCQTNEDCAHLVGTTVCDISAGQCVECTGTDYASCGTLDGTPLVCDSLQRSCTTSKQHGADLCNPCVSDAQCKLGQRCMMETFEGTELGYRCFWERGASEGGAPLGCSQAPPYVTTRNDETSIDGATVDVCALRISTCKAHKDFSNVDCEGSEDVPDTSRCGEPDLNDAGCSLYDTVGEDNIYRCTVRCLGNDDCPDDDLECSTTSPRVCDLNP